MGTHILNQEKAIAFNLNPAEYNVMIRITSPTNDFIQLKNEQIYREVLCLRFFDLEDETTGLNIFNESHLEVLINFFERHKFCKNMVIHCEEGRSRSAGVAIGWFLFNDNISSIYKLYHDKIHLPNRRVVNLFFKYFKRSTKNIDKWEEECYKNLM